MTRRYYSSRNSPTPLTLGQLYWKLQHLYMYFRDSDYFKSKTGITQRHIPDAVKHEAAVALTFQPFPMTKWDDDDVTEDHVFDTLEFLFDRAAKPGEMVGMTSETGFNYYDYESYDQKLGREEFRQMANSFLSTYGPGYELTEDGTVLALGTDGLQQILGAEIPRYDEADVDSKVRSAILKWRNRHLALAEKRQAIRELADVFEWLKKTKKLERVLDKKDEAALFDIANNFAIRHHDPRQKTNYDTNIWYSWMFHFYLATYHAVVRLLIEDDAKSRGA